MKKILFLLLALTANNLFSMEEKQNLIVKIKQFATDLSGNIMNLSKDISSLVADTKQAYTGARSSFRNVNSYIYQIKTAQEVFKKIDTALKMIDEESILINDLVNLLYSTSKAVGSSADIINPFSSSISLQGKAVAKQIEDLAQVIITTGIATREIVRPLRTAMKQIISTLIVLNRDLNPNLKKSLPLDQSILLDQAPKAETDLEQSEREFEKEMEEWQVIHKP